MSLPTLTLGDFDLTDWSGSIYGASVIAEGTSRGGPVSLDVAVQSWLQDGSIVVTQGYDNREVTIRVRMRAPDLLALAEAEAALFAELGKPNLLTWTPADGYGPPSVFAVITSQMVEAPGPDGDIAEGSHSPWRTYNLSLTCEAFVRSATEVVTAAEKSGDTTTPPTVTQVTVDDGTSAANWSAEYFRYFIDGSLVTSGNTTVTTAAAALNAATPGFAQQVFRTLIRMKKQGISIDVSNTKQISVTWRWDQIGYSTDYWNSNSFECVVNESTGPITLQKVDGIVQPSRGVYTTTVFKVPATLSTISQIRLSVELAGSYASYDGTQIESLYIDNIERNNANLASGTPRQLQRSIVVPGSARSQSRVSISHNVSALGDVLAYFRPEDGSSFSPPLRRWRTAGPGVNVDAALVSGVYDNIASPGTITFKVPAQRVPRGRYLLMARLGGADTSCEIQWNAGTMFGATDVGPTQTGFTTIALTTAYRIHPIARLQLPTRDMDDSTSADVRVEMLALPTSGSVCRLDEAWLFEMSTGRLIQVPCGTGTPAVGGPASRVWIEPASVTRPRPTVRIGSQANGSDARYALDASFTSWQFPELTPPSVQVFTVTTNALDAAVEAAAFPRFHTHAAL